MLPMLIAVDAAASIALATALHAGSALRLLASAAAWILLLAVFGLYRDARRDAGRVIGAVAAASLIVSAVLQAPVDVRTLLWVSAVATIALAARALAVRISSALRTVILGTNDEAARLATTMRAPGSRYTPLGYVTPSTSLETFDGLPILGTLASLDDVVERYGIQCVFVAANGATAEQIRAGARVARRYGVRMQVGVAMPRVIPTTAVLENGDEGVSVRLPAGLSPAQRFIKRLLDVVLATTLFVVTLPILLIVAAAVRVTSKGPVFYRGERVTVNGRVFRMFKFRTMVVDADDWMREHSLDLSTPFFKLSAREPLTPIGRFLRKTSLDELPQLLDVIRGEMSMVGPRPLPVEQVRANPELLAPRHEMKAGITGWWQIGGRNEIDAAASVERDLFYIENWSLGLDLMIIAKTLPSLLGGGQS